MRTPLFGIDMPDPNSRDWGQRFVQMMADLEQTLGCNSHLAMVADTSHGLVPAFGLAAYASSETVVSGSPVDGRWGRLVPQSSLVHGSRALCMFLGKTRMLGLDNPSANATVYAEAISNRFTVDPNAAIVASSSGVSFLPLGFAFGDADWGFLNGLRPIVRWPTRPTASGVQVKPGVNDPAGSFAVVFDSGPALEITFDESAIQQYIDLVFPTSLPADFLAWSSVDDVNIWAFKSLIKTTGDAQVSVHSVTDSSGAEHAIAGVIGSSIGSYGGLTLSHKKIYDVDGDWARSGSVMLRLRCQGSESAVVRVRPTCLMQYMPAVAWSV